MKDKIIHRQMRFSFSWLMGAVCAILWIRWVCGGVLCSKNYKKNAVMEEPYRLSHTTSQTATLRWWENYLVCAHMPSLCHSHVICMPLVSTCTSSICHSYVVRMSLACTCMSIVCHSHAFVCQPYVTRMYPYVIRMSRVSRVYFYVIRLSFYHKPITVLHFQHFP